MNINVYDKDGIISDSIKISDTIEYVDGRVSKGTNCYYKGLGIPYEFHHIQPSDMCDDYNFISACDVFYIGNLVSKKSFIGKYGIFQEKYQTHFTDWIGACGVKELNIFENLYDEGAFEMSAIDVLGYETINEDKQQYYLKVDYPNGRNNYLTNPNPKKLRSLLDYMIQNDWNFPWDKNSISDINSESKVTDVADIFKSSELSHKIGTVYSVLHSLEQSNKNDYLEFCKENSLIHSNKIGFIVNVLIILQQNNVDVRFLYGKSPIETYKKIILEYLIIGKNCGFCGVGSCKRREDSNQSYGEEIKNEYIRRAKAELNINI
jgi:hypothetical protein